MSTDSSRHLEGAATNGRIARIEQAITGHSIGPGVRGGSECCQCKATLREGTPVTVYASRVGDEGPVSISRVYCSTCDRREVKHPAAGCEEYVAEAHLVTVSDVTTQSHRHALAGVSILDESAVDDKGEWS